MIPYWVLTFLLIVAGSVTLFCLVAVADLDRYLTLDCRDGKHLACATCSCRCHSTPEALR